MSAWLMSRVFSIRKTLAMADVFVYPGIDEPLALVRNGQSVFYHADGLGSIIALTDSSEAVVQRYAYSVFGEATASTGFLQPYGFTGRELDGETGLMSYRARYFDPTEGRFIGKDPLGLLAGDVNFYRYVGNNPVGLVDPWGLIKWTGGLFFNKVSHGLYSGGVAYMHLESECLNNKKIVGDFQAYFGGVGIPFSKKINIPVSSSSSPISFVGPDNPSKNDPVGVFSMIGVGVGAAGGFSAASIESGNIVNHHASGVYIGFDSGSFDALIGVTFPIYVKETTCCETTK